MPDAHPDDAPDDLPSRKVLVVDHGSAITMKRDVRTFDVNVPAAEFTKAFHDVMRKPGEMFGLIEVVRMKGRRGELFEVKERFQGRFRLDDALVEAAPQGFFKRLVKRFADWLLVEEVLEFIADKMVSDYGEITEMDTSVTPDKPARIAYRYLDGTPIAGQSIFTVEILEEKLTRFTQTFEYQEQSKPVVYFMGTTGLAMHNKVVFEEVKDAAEACGGKIVRTDIAVPT